MFWFSLWKTNRACLLQCPPCRGFTPELIKTYNKLKDAGKNFEILFASSDQGEAQFKEYWGTMPWLSLPFQDKRIEQLSARFEVEGTCYVGCFS